MTGCLPASPSRPVSQQVSCPVEGPQGPQQPSAPWQRAVRGPHRSPSLGRRRPSGRSPTSSLSPPPTFLLPSPGTQSQGGEEPHLCLRQTVFPPWPTLPPNTPGAGGPWGMVSPLQLALVSPLVLPRPALGPELPALRERLAPEAAEEENSLRFLPGCPGKQEGGESGQQGRILSHL